jgi:hypothetical protein
LIWHADGTNLNWIADFIWRIADDVLGDLYDRGIIEGTGLRRKITSGTRFAVERLRLY